MQIQCDKPGVFQLSNKGEKDPNVWLDEIKGKIAEKVSNLQIVLLLLPG